MGHRDEPLGGRNEFCVEPKRDSRAKHGKRLATVGRRTGVGEPREHIGRLCRFYIVEPLASPTAKIPVVESPVDVCTNGPGGGCLSATCGRAGRDVMTLVELLPSSRLRWRP